MTHQFEQMLLEDQRLIENYLNNCFTETLPQKRLLESMRYSLLAGGKRIRPVLVLEWCRLCGGSEQAALPLAAAVEMVHTYSLIHDDLPCMDNDDYRRGKLTNHKVYGEAGAVLAGDALLTAAFETLTQAPLPAAYVVDAVRILSAAAGERGMVGGQVLDVGAHSEAELQLIHSLKTGAMIRAAAVLGVIAGGGTPAIRDAADRYAAAIGMAFQIRDDLLDVYGNAEKIGKSIGSDQENEKCTFVTVYGVEGCEERIAALTRQAQEALAALPNHEFLDWLAGALAGRER